MCEYTGCVWIQYVLNMCICSVYNCTVLFSGLSPLHLAVLRGHRDLARMLLDAGSNINAMVSSAMTQFHKYHIYRLGSHWLFPRGVFLSYQDIKSGQSPLMHAVENNNADMVHFLIEVMRLCGEMTGCDSAVFDQSGSSSSAAYTLYHAFSFLPVI